jgi:hypothetical protein
MVCEMARFWQAGTGFRRIPVFAQNGLQDGFLHDS